MHQKMLQEKLFYLDLSESSSKDESPKGSSFTVVPGKSCNKQKKSSICTNVLLNLAAKSQQRQHQ